MKHFVLALSFTFLPLAVQAAAFLPGNPAAGKKLHAAQCVACHDSSLYTRANRRVKTVEGLMKQVNGCNTQLKTNLSGDQINDLVIYLNETYYRFD
jgi:mono/diheme cytochrome c family protein